MTRFNPPLTPAETTALQQACAAMDAERLNKIYDIHKSKFYALFWFEDGDDYYEAYHLAAALLAGQMAERL